MHYRKQSLFVLLLFSSSYFVFGVPHTRNGPILDHEIASSDIDELHGSVEDDVPTYSSKEANDNGKQYLLKEDSSVIRKSRPLYSVHKRLIQRGTLLGNDNIHSAAFKKSEENIFINAVSQEMSLNDEDGPIFHESQESGAISNSSHEVPLIISLIPENFEAPPINLYSSAGELLQTAQEFDKDLSTSTLPSEIPDHPLESEPTLGKLSTSDKLLVYDEPSVMSEDVDFITSESVLHRPVRSNGENIIFNSGTCKNCHKVLLRDTIMRCNKKGRVSTIVSYDGVGCVRDEYITCVKVTDMNDPGEGANVFIKSGAVGLPYIKLNITSYPDKGYNLYLEIRGRDLSKPECT